jgi:peptidoglycan/LPS O-acetylase OafA/YrhL
VVWAAGALPPRQMTGPTDPPASVAPASTNASRGGALDALRFAAALLIMLYHFGSESPIKLYRLNEVFARGYLATDFFLMLSGYVLGRAYGPALLAGKVGAGRFWLRRASRIWPAHLIVLVAFGLYIVIGLQLGATPNPARFSAQSFLQQAVLIHAWAPLPPAEGWNLPTWSLSALLVCYAAFPWMWRGLSRVRPAGLIPIIGLGVVALADYAARNLFDRPLYDLPFQLGLFRAVPLFLLGACLARAAAMSWPDPPVARGMLWGGLALFVLSQSFGRWDLLSMAAIACVILGAGRLPVTKPNALLERAAKMSFALFITHTLVGVMYWDQIHMLIFKVKIPLLYQWSMWVAGFPLAIAVAWAFDRWIDQPIQNRLAPLLRAKPKA